MEEGPNEMCVGKIGRKSDVVRGPDQRNSASDEVPALGGCLTVHQLELA
jgi:hypothetical protein